MLENQLLGDYQILKKIGKGSLGEVHLAEHRFIKKQFAVKILPESLSQDRGFIQRFQEDVANLALLDHTNLVNIHNVSFDKGVYFLVLECVADPLGEPTTLDHYLSHRNGPLSEQEVIEVLQQVGSALDYAHSKRSKGIPLVHRGLKLSNILIGKGKEKIHVKVSDFGLSRIIGVGRVLLQLMGGVAHSLENLDPQEEELTSLQIKTAQHSFLKQFSFLAPEQKFLDLEEDKITIESDVYAFGVLAYYLLTQEMPEGIFPMPESLREGLRCDWGQLIVGCMQKNPQARPQSLSHILQEVQENSSSCYSVPIHSSKVEVPQEVAFSGAKRESSSPKPLLQKGRLERPTYDPDPLSVLQVDSTVKAYHPELTKRKDDAQPIPTEMVIIVGGNFYRGSNEGSRDEMPRHQVHLESFAMDTHPVTNEQFVRFLEAMGAEKDAQNRDLVRLRESRIKRQAGRLLIESGYAKHPVVGVTWYGATSYAQWVGKRLPSEAEWEVAAYGGVEGYSYPTGDDIEKSQANFFSSDTTPVMSYTPNGYGLYDIVGNVYEWCQDWYGYNYYEMSMQEPHSPKGSILGTYRTLRGGCWKSLKEDLRCSHRHRNKPGTFNSTYSFRCIADVD